MPEPVVTEQEANAGEYTFLCARFSAAYMDRMYELGGVGSDLPDQYVAMPDMVGETVTLEADGSGYLYWGDNNQGPIDWWKLDGDALQFQAGVAVINGTIADGLMTLTMGKVPRLKQPPTFGLPYSGNLKVGGSFSSRLIGNVCSFLSG